MSWCVLRPEHRVLLGAWAVALAACGPVVTTDLARVRFGDSALPLALREASAPCVLPPLPAGSYTLRYDGRAQPFTVPGTLGVDWFPSEGG